MKISDVVKFNAVDRVIKFLDTAPRDELYTVQDISRKYDIPESTIKTSRVLLNYRIKYGGRNYFGSPVSIREFARQASVTHES